VISNLEVRIEPTNNCKILKVVDNSIYNPNIVTENAILEITVPGYNCPVVFNVTPGFTLLLNSSNLEIATAASYAALLPLPEGIYKIKYSIKPNKYLSVEYDYLRNCQQFARYITAVCRFFDKKCTFCEEDIIKYRKDLVWIRELIDAAKFKVEECADPIAGLDLYNEANKLILRINGCFDSCRV
jgi:hypothetical protein